MFRCLFLLLLIALPSHAIERKAFPAEAPGSKGTVIVLADAGAVVDSGHWQRTLLRTLPRHGWRALSVAQYEGLSSLPEALQSEPEPHYWVVSGATAGEAVNAMATQQLPLPAGLVVLGPFRQTPAENDALPAQLAELGIAVLDMSGPGDHPLAQATTEARQQANRRTANPHYRAMEWALDWDQSADTLAQRIRGWLKQQKTSPQ
ncbi:DUF3530 family protein [Ferrimonas balearica]|uniref:DUF3530 family protein n=1 Tax=Ferrimonas balearica TaxID=44012 RepID=UPI001C979865|nr:DUF3530 family protein [Ferrimonas balearica]MBY5981616.1 alpha/beta hydrolase family protein [Ferrimonas balearica]